MGNYMSINKITFKDMQKIINNKDYYIINTLDKNNQECLIKNTYLIDQEIDLINKLIKTNNKNINLVLYGKNCLDNSVIDKYNQLIKLGFKSIFIYVGGMFEWLLLQDIYGNSEFLTTKKEYDILKYSS